MLRKCEDWVTIQHVRVARLEVQRHASRVRQGVNCIISWESAQQIETWFWISYPTSSFHCYNQDVTSSRVVWVSILAIVTRSFWVSRITFTLQLALSWLWRSWRTISSTHSSSTSTSTGWISVVSADSQMQAFHSCLSRSSILWRLRGDITLQPNKLFKKMSGFKEWLAAGGDEMADIPESSLPCNNSKLEKMDRPNVAGMSTKSLLSIRGVESGEDGKSTSQGSRTEWSRMVSRLRFSARRHLYGIGCAALQWSRKG